MLTLRNPEISPPEHQFLVAFSVAGGSAAMMNRRMIRVLAATPQQAARICKASFPDGRHVQVFRRPMRTADEAQPA